MERHDISTGRPGAEPVAVPAVVGQARFRTESEPGIDALNRRWQATYSHGQSWSHFSIAIDLSRHKCTLSRVPETDYSPLLKELAGKPPDSISPIPPPSRRVDSLTLDVEIIGLKMPRVREGSSGPSGDWLVVQAYLPGSTESFLLGVSNRLGAGEIVVSRPESGPAVVDVLSQVFG
jgi:hypothetical protein